MEKYAANVIEFNQKVLGIQRDKIASLSVADQNFLVNAIVEETVEFKTACQRNEIVGQVDALVDLIYFSIGGLYKLGLSAEQINKCAQAVHLANMTKKRGVKESRGDGTVPDAVKSEEWMGPEERIFRILIGRD